MRWKEFRLWYRLAYNPDEVFAFKKDVLVPALDGTGSDYVFILDEQDPESKECFVLVRLELTPDAETRVKAALEQAISTSSQFTRITVEDWSPVQDARNRIQSALARTSAQGKIPTGAGWQVLGRDTSGKFVVGAKNYDEQTEEFVKFMSEVAGRFTVAYLRAMPRRVEDRWLKSLFVHLLLNSISTHQGEENEIRDFPYI